MKYHDPNAITNKKGTHLLESFLPVEWILQPFTNDFGLDFHIEVVNNKNVLLGKTFYIQLKTQEESTYINDGANVSLGVEEKHLSDWAQRTAPIFLCVIDLKKQEGYWFFLTTYLRENTEWKKLKNRESKLQIHIPVENKLIETERFRAEVMNAIAFCDSVPFAVINEQERLRSLDSRFNYEVSFLDGKEYIKLLPANENILLKFTFNGEREDLKKFRMGHEVKVKFAKSSSPIWPEGSEGIIKFYGEEKITAALEVHNEQTGNPTVLSGFYGYFRKSIDGMQIAIEHPCKMITIQVNQLEDDENIFYINWDYWKNKEVNSLLCLDFLSELANNPKLKIKYFTEQMESYIDIDLCDNDFTKYKDFFTIVYAVRDISKKFNIPIMYDAILDFNDNEKLRHLGLIYHLFVTNNLQNIKTNEKNCIFTFSKESDLSKYKEVKGSMNIASNSNFKLLGYNIQFKSIISFSDVESCRIEKNRTEQKLIVKNSVKSVITHKAIEDSISFTT